MKTVQQVVSKEKKAANRSLVTAYLRTAGKFFTVGAVAYTVGTLIGCAIVSNADE